MVSWLLRTLPPILTTRVEWRGDSGDEIGFSIHVIDSSEHSGALLNINGDTAAGEIARELEADSMVFLTDVEGVMDSHRRLIGRLTASQGADLMRSGTITGGMTPKVEACLRALERVRVAQILDGRRSRALLDFVEGRPSGTRIG